MKKTSKTNQLGTRTQKYKGRYDRLAVHNKDPEYDYSFRRKDEIQDDGYTLEGFQAVGKTNSAGESWARPEVLQKHRSGSSVSQSQLVVEDVVLCKRHKEVTSFYKAEEDERYNQQMKLIKENSNNAKLKFRQIGIDATVTDNSRGLKTTQRIGPTQG